MYGPAQTVFSGSQALGSGKPPVSLHHVHIWNAGCGAGSGYRTVEALWEWLGGVKYYNRQVVTAVYHIIFLSLSLV